MTVARSIILAALILVIGGGAAAWWVTPRYSLTNMGQGVSIRLDRMSGSMIGCRELNCRTIVDRNEIKQEVWPGKPVEP